MKKLLLIILLLINGLTYGQNIPPTGTNFKILPTYSFGYFSTDSTLWVYKGSVLGWTKLASGNNLKYKVDSIFSKVYTRAQADGLFQSIIAAGTAGQYWAGNKTWQTLNTTAVAEGSNLYYTDARARNAISLTTTGSSGVATYSAGVLNIPGYTLSGLGGIASVTADYPLTGSGTTGSHLGLGFSATNLKLTANALNTIQDIAPTSNVTFATVGATTFTGALSGNATTATTATTATSQTITEDLSTNASVYPTWVTANTGNMPEKVSSSKLYFNPSTGLLTATGFSGPLTGNATTATTATIAVNTGVTDDVATATTVYPTWKSSNSGNLPDKVSSTKLYFVPSTGNLTTTTFTGALAGNATSATTASSATNTAITDDNALNATVYPTWVTATSGNLPEKVSSTKLSFNPSTGYLTAANLSGSNTGDETSATIKSKLGIAANTLSGNNTGDQTITLTGDVTGSGTGSFPATLATVNSNIGTFNNVTVNAKGLVTAASSVNYKGGADSTASSGYASNYKLGLKANASLIGANSGIAQLDINGKVPISQINSTLLGSVNYQGTYNANTNQTSGATVLPTAAGNKGYYYIISVAGTQLSIPFSVGDWIISDGTAWTKVDNNNAVTKVFNRVGNVVAASGDYNSDQVTEGSTNLYFNNTRARAAISPGTGISISSGVITNTMPDQTVALTASPLSGITVTGSYPSYSVSVNKVEVTFTNTAAPVISSYDASYSATFGQSPRVLLITTDLSGNEVIRSEQATLNRSAGKIQSISYDLPLAESGRIVLF